MKIIHFKVAEVQVLLLALFLMNTMEPLFFTFKRNIELATILHMFPGWLITLKIFQKNFF
jgi:hypothetical protein